MSLSNPIDDVIAWWFISTNLVENDTHEKQFKIHIP